MEEQIYKPKHIEIFTFSEDILDPNFLNLVKEAKKLLELKEKDEKQFTEKRKELLSKILTLECKGVYSLQIFTKDFCQKLVEEFLNFESHNFKITRPNSMNNYGAILEEMGLQEPFDEFIKGYIKYLFAIMNKNSMEIDSHHSFIVEYEEKKDVNLDFHVDDSEMTINTCLGLNFKGGAIYFNGLEGQPLSEDDYDEYDHVVGRSIIHDGKHRHGALEIESGHRINLITWCRSSKYRELLKEK